MGKNLGAARLIFCVVPLLWAGCAKNNPTANDVFLSRPDELLAKKGFIASGQRVQELEVGGHPVQQCGVCHSSAFGGPTIQRHCPDCHPDQAANLNHPVITTRISDMCVICHMPFATFDSDSVNKYQADVRTHVFKLRVSAEKKWVMFRQVEGGTAVFVDGGLTLDLSCYQCHKDLSGVGGAFVPEAMETLAGRAAIIHSATPPGKEAQ